MHKPLHFPARLFHFAIAAACLLPHAAHAAASASSKFSFSSILTLPFLLALAVALHVLLGRAAKAVASSVAPLATGELESGSYQRGVYGSPERAMLEVVGLALASGLVMWIASAFAIGWLWGIAVLMLLGAITLDVLRWERVTASASYLWCQRGLRAPVEQIAIENIAEATVDERDVEGFSLRHFKNNRMCRLLLQMKDGQAVKLPKTDAAQELDAVESLANHVRARQQFIEERHKVKHSSDEGSKAAREAAQKPSSVDAELALELRRLRQRSLAPSDVPAAVKAAVKPAGHEG